MPSEGAPTIDFGEIKPDAFGIPMLNSAIRIWFVDAAGKPIAAASLHDDGVAGFDFAVRVFGWGRGFRAWQDGRLTSGGRRSLDRSRDRFSCGQFSYGYRIESFYSDRTQAHARNAWRKGRGFKHGRLAVRFRRSRLAGVTSLSGHPPSRLKFGAGDLDAIEFYMLNLPPPAILQSDASSKGGKVFNAIGCATCHVDKWTIEKDRRRFLLEPVTGVSVTGVSRIELRLRDVSPGSVANVLPFSDFRHWDIGHLFHEHRFDGTVQTTHRTAPLWGVANTAPYGHDGRFESFEQVIVAHSGAADVSARAFEALSIKNSRSEVIAFLNSLQLYSTLETPADIDGDGVASEDFKVGRIRVGREVFQPRFLLLGGLDVEVFCCVPLPSGGQRPLFKPRASTAAWGAPTTPVRNAQ